MKLSTNVSKVEPSLTMAISARAGAMKAQGIDVIPLSAGEPDFATPRHICDAGIAAINGGQTRYTPVSGMPSLKQAICRQFERDNGLSYEPDQVIVNCGAKHSVYLAVMAQIDPGDEVIVPAPYWVSYPDMVKLAGGTPVILDTHSEQGLKITPSQLKAAITDRTRILVLNSPSNPTGMVYSREELAALGEVIVEAGITVISDEIYQKLVYDGHTHCSLASLDDRLYRQTITVNGVSKAFSKPGWRIGYAAGPKEIITAMSTIQSQETSSPCSISQHAALAALEGPKDFIGEWVAEFSKRRLYVSDRLKAIDGISCIVPGGAFYVFPDVSALYGRTFGGKRIDGSLAFSEYMLNERHVALVPGIGFGNDNHVRISYAASLETLEEAMNRFEAGIQSLD